MRRTLLDSQPQALVVEARTAKDGSQFPHIVDHTLITIFLAGFGGSNRHKDALGPVTNSPAGFDELPV